MELSQVLKLNALSKWSPNGELLACVDENTVKLLPIADPTTAQVFAASGPIKKFAWAPDSRCFCCLISGLIHIFSPEDPTSVCQVEDPHLPIVAVQWAPDSCHIVAATECCIRLCMWRVSGDLRNEEAPVLTCRRPKFPLSAGQAFSPSGQLWVVCTREECVDSLEVFTCPTASTASVSWTVFKVFRVKTADLQDLLWTPDETSVVVWDSFLHGSRILLYHISGQLLHQIEDPSGEHLSIRHVKLHAADRLLAVGFCDGSIRLFSTIHWREERFSPLLHERKVLLHEKLLILREELKDPPQKDSEQQEEERVTHRSLSATRGLSPPRRPMRLSSNPRLSPAGAAAHTEGPTVLRCVGNVAAGSGSSEGEVKSRSISAGEEEGETSAEESSLRSSDPAPRIQRQRSKVSIKRTAQNDSERKTKEEAKDTKKRINTQKRHYFLLPCRKTDPAFSSPSASSVSQSVSKQRVEKWHMYFPVEKEIATLRPEGIILMQFSPCGTFLASTNAEHPTVVFIWNLTSGQLEGLCIHRSHVKQMQWNPHPAAFASAACLAVCTGDPRIYIWTAPWQSVVELPKIALHDQIILRYIALQPNASVSAAQE